MEEEDKTKFKFEGNIQSSESEEGSGYVSVEPIETSSYSQIPIAPPPPVAPQSNLPKYSNSSYNEVKIEYFINYLN